MPENTNLDFPLDIPEIKSLAYSLHEMLKKESARGAILIATTCADEYLSGLIEIIFPKEMSKKTKGKICFKYINTFSAKIDLSYSFRLIDKELFDALHELREIRNRAAHSKKNFDVKTLSDQLTKTYNFFAGHADLIRFKASYYIKSVIREQLIDIGKKHGQDSSMAETTAEEIIAQKLKYDENYIKNQAFSFEVVYAISLLCRMIFYHREAISKYSFGSNTFAKNVDEIKMSPKTLGQILGEASYLRKKQKEEK